QERRAGGPGRGRRSLAAPARPVAGSARVDRGQHARRRGGGRARRARGGGGGADRKSTRLNSSHGSISYAVFCLKKKKKTIDAFCVEYSRQPIRESKWR